MEETIIKINDEVIDLSSDVEKLVKEAVDKCCLDLDNIVFDIRSAIMEDITIVTNETLHKMIADLATMLYASVSQLENLGIKEDVSKKLKNDVFSRVKQETEGTVANKEAAATLASQSEDVVLTVYSRAYKQAKSKIDAGYEVLNVIKKILTTRISELELSNSRYIGTNIEEEKINE